MRILPKLNITKYSLSLSIYLVFIAVTSTPASAITQQDARLLLTRTGFEPTQGEIAALAAAPTRAAAAAQLIAGITTSTAIPVPAWSLLPRPSLVPSPTADELAAYGRLVTGQKNDMLSWWPAQMVATPSPLTERLALFWTNHFTSQITKVQSAWIMWQQFLKIRQNAGGSFASMLGLMIHDPAMLVFLDQADSTAKAPIGNFARELMELFTVGEGNYSETDVTEVARSLTGLTLSPDGLPLYNARIHDNGTKTVLGKTGNLGPDDIVQILLANPNTATLIVTELWQEFVSSTPNPATIRTLAASFQSSGYQIGPLLQSLFTNAAFWDPNNRGTLVKSPAEFVVGAVRELGLPTSQMAVYQQAIYVSGQKLFEPPNVRGYLTGVNWVNTVSLIYRQRVATALSAVFQTLPPAPGNSPATVSPSAFTGFADPRLGDQPILAAPTTTLSVAAAQQLVMSDPAYWLK